MIIDKVRYTVEKITGPKACDCKRGKYKASGELGELTMVRISVLDGDGFENWQSWPKDTF